MKRGRPKKTWQQLRQSAKPSVWKRRRAETEAAAIPAQALEAFLNAWKLENETFVARCVPGEVICRQLDGSKFSWTPDHYLTMARDYAQKVVTGPDQSGPWTTELSQRFMNDLATGSAQGFYLDPLACETLKLMYAAFETPDTDLNLLRLLAAVEFLAWKRSDSSYRFADELLLDCHPEDVKVMDAGFKAQKKVYEASAQI